MRRGIAAVVAALAATFAVAGCHMGGDIGLPDPASSSPATVDKQTSIDLSTQLMALPDGSTAWTSDWGQDLTPTLGAFAANFYPSENAEDVAARLAAQGLVGIAHHAWTAADSDAADDVLLEFTSADGALSRYLSAANSQAPGTTKVTVPGIDGAAGYTDGSLDDQGYSRTVFFVQRGDVVCELTYFSLARYAPADAQAWLQAQVARLH